MEKDEKKGKGEHRIALYLCFGAAIGTSIGVVSGSIFDNVALGASFGPAMGVVAGLILWVIVTQN